MWEYQDRGRKYMYNMLIVGIAGQRQETQNMLSSGIADKGSEGTSKTMAGHIKYVKFRKHII
jgi:hypothetical protein